MKRIIRSAAFLAAVLAGVACNMKVEKEIPREAEAVPQQEEFTILSVSLPGDATKTVLGPSDGSSRKVFWTDGDQLSCNGTASVELSGIPSEAQSAVFSFPGVVAMPYHLLYPAAFYKDASTITLPESQTWEEGGFATGTLPFSGYVGQEVPTVSLSHLGAVVHLKVKKDAGVSASRLVSVSFEGRAGEQVAGDFTIDYTTASLTGAAAAGVGRKVSVTLSEPLSESTALDIYLVVPAQTYTSGFKVTMVDEFNRAMTKVRSVSATLAPGLIANMPELSFVPSGIATEFALDPMQEAVLPPEAYNITGRVVDNSGNPLEGVVVSDGLQCVRSMVDGSFYMNSTLSAVKFVHLSTPSGYLPAVAGGIPRFYKAKADVTPAGGIYNFGDFVLTPVANPDRFTLFITADPQPRASNINLDNVAYRSLRACESMYKDLQETAAAITDRQVYGICLGDLVHEDMDLMDTYATNLGTLGYPTYNIIGNHDNDPVKSDDNAAAWKFEALFGPRNYSFNIGGIHFVVLDNLIMKDNGSGRLTAYDQGLTDDVWKWLQEDMAYIPTSTPVMVCAHSPMFKQINGNERSNTAAYGPEYGALFDKYDEVHAWAGHTHVGFNYVYPSSHRHKKVQVHTLARSTGELWTNEYLAAGTPRGFTIVEVENGAVTSWKFHPTKYLRSSFHGTYGQPSYNYADWNFTAVGSQTVALMKDSGEELDESYQMHVYAPGVYEPGYVYANIFLWDALWDTPTLSVNGGAPVQMELLDAASSYDAADKEIRDFYYAKYSLLRAAGYTQSTMGETVTIFKAAAPVSGTGTVSVTDRFGNVYSRQVSW